MKAKAPPPCRLQFLLARRAPIAVIFRRGPSKWVQLIKWDTKTDSFEPGQWFHGHVYVGRSVAAGATVALAEPTTDDLADFVTLLNRNAPALPTGFVEPTPSAFRGGRAWMAYMMHGSVTTDFSGNLMESRIGRWRIELPRKKGLAPRSYVAVLRQNPGVETGVPATTDEMSLHLLNGYF